MEPRGVPHRHPTLFVHGGARHVRRPTCPSSRSRPRHAPPIPTHSDRLGAPPGGLSPARRGGVRVCQLARHRDDAGRGDGDRTPQPRARHRRGGRADGAASAAGAREQRPAIDAAGFQVAKREGLSLEQAAARIQRQTGGRILSADVLNRKGRVVYRIKVLMPSGHVRIFRVDAESGAAD